MSLCLVSGRCAYVVVENCQSPGGYLETRLLGMAIVQCLEFADTHTKSASSEISLLLLSHGVVPRRFLSQGGSSSSDQS
jgi:hypothetical protein